MKKTLLFALVALLGFPLAAAAAITGDCAVCHTMHNSEENAPVAVTGLTATPSATPIANLLKFDCIACHAQNTSKIVNGIPQVYHADATGDLAAGNFRYIADADPADANRKGHNVIDLFPDGDTTGADYTRPPGFTDNTSHESVFGTNNFTRFTCAGAGGCHGTRNQLLSEDVTTSVRRTSMAAISGAHHQSTDGKRSPVQNVAATHDGARVAAGYRFIPGLKGMGNTDAAGPWQNLSGTSHNEYFGDATDQLVTSGTGSCNTCHVGGTTKDLDSQILVPNQSMSGFCSTCHGDFHSMGTENGSSGAFLRHPSDYVIPDTVGSEYAAYTVYNITAPVARNATTFDAVAFDAPSGTVTPGADMVMCLSCHQAHASEYNAMLRFDYAAMDAGGSLTGADRDGCLACHTNK